MPLAGTDAKIWELKQEIEALRSRLGEMNIFWYSRAVSWEEVRANREALLNDSDWTQMSDGQLSAEDKTAWATYRQELRDLPAIFENVEHVNQVEWPKQPGSLGYDAGQADPNVQTEYGSDDSGDNGPNPN